MDARVWHDGEPVGLDDQEWARLAGTFLGVGFRLLVPGHAAGVAGALARARRVAEVVGGVLDEVPWTMVGGAGPVEVTGGWQRSLSGGLGPCWTRVSPVSPAPDSEAVARVLPWRLDRRSPTFGLPMLSGLLDREAARWLAGHGAAVGIWLDTDGVPVGTTAGDLVTDEAAGTTYAVDALGARTRLLVEW